VVALIVVVTFVVLVLGVLVAGLLRSHADILRSLHELGVGVGDPAVSEGTTAAGVETSAPHSSSLVGAVVPDIAGVTPRGDARAVSVTNSDQLTLLAFLSSGCGTCSGFWRALQHPDRVGLPRGVRSVIVTKGPELEVPSEVASKTTGQIPVVMSTEAWLDYQVPGSPFFVLVDGSTGRRVGHGVANHVGQLVDLIRRAEHDASASWPGPRDDTTRMAGPAREASADEVLLAAGIRPGDPSLYPKSLDDLFPSEGQ
jgi:hypothetical protein